MPYIKKMDRVKFDDMLFEDLNPETPGELNYLITMLAIRYCENKGITYTNINETVGAMECAKLEFYRKMTVPYEEKKIQENGDVY